MAILTGTPIIKRFEISGLHGYKNVSVEFSSPAKILIAENGAGKTTILNMLYFFLRGEFGKLRKYSFEKIECNVQDKSWILKKEDIFKKSKEARNSSVDIILTHGVDEDELIQFVLDDYEMGDYNSLRHTDLGLSLYTDSPWDWEEIGEMLDSAKEYYSEAEGSNLKNISSEIREYFSNTEVLYLPTYRRIEKPKESLKIKKNLARSRFFTSTHHFQMQMNIDDSNTGDFNDINYGLSDVESRLAKITEEIQRKSNSGYRQISASIIGDMFRKDFLSSSQLMDLPDKEAMKRFFSRVGMGAEGEGSDIDQIWAVYDNPEAVGDNISFLRYFVSKLSTVVSQTQELELSIETFVSKANQYLGCASDPKELIYDAESMSVRVVNQWTSQTVELDELSSGEKQVVSLLAYLYLYEGNKIILIDEPELSLSMEWQQRILIDIVSAPICQQLLAITHSPFIFDNSLDPYASALEIVRKDACHG